jgi:hypothetical protein
MSGNYGTAYGREIKPDKLGQLARRLALCDQLDALEHEIKVTLEWIEQTLERINA